MGGLVLGPSLANHGGEGEGNEGGVGLVEWNAINKRVLYEVGEIDGWGDCGRYTPVYMAQGKGKPDRPACPRRSEREVEGAKKGSLGRSLSFKQGGSEGMPHTQGG